MKIGFRVPSFKKSISATFSIKKRIMPRFKKGYGFIRNPEKAIYNRIYNRTTIPLIKWTNTNNKKSIIKNTSCKNMPDSHREKDILFDEAIEFIKNKYEINTTILQRQYAIGYVRASNLLEDLYRNGLIKPQGKKFVNINYVAPPEEKDPLFEEVARIAVSRGEISQSIIQRTFKLGYHRANILLNNLEDAKIIKTYKSLSKPPVLLVHSEKELNDIFIHLK
ncbi:MAG: hypothetical protein EPN37_04425 [Chitinophagaceae bacterium]|nr:MAG: hypothetical protein EPN37_04425 [Chitinophagaceae bacterium]